MDQKSDNKKMSNPKSGKAISNMDFAKLHPMDGAVQATDTYYTFIANKIYKILTPLTLKGYTHEFVRQTALSLAAYFEDQVSELGLWRAFVAKNRELSGKWLPWYDTTEEYFEDEVNLQDIQFLIWMKLTVKKDEEIVFPLDIEIRSLAETVYALMLNEFEKAPINQKLYDMLYSDYFSSDFQNLKKLLRWLASDCYLMSLPVVFEQQRQEMVHHFESMTRRIKNDKSFDKDVVENYCGINLPVGPLALRPNQWYALMRSTKGLTYDNEDILSLEGTPYYPFGVIAVEADTLQLRSCRGVEYRVDKASFNPEMARVLRKGDVIVTVLGRYRDKWYSNGAFFLNRGKDEAEMTNTLERAAATLHNALGMCTDFFGVVDTKAVAKITEEQAKILDKLIEDNHQSRLFYFPSMKAAFEWEDEKLDVKMPWNDNLENTPEMHKPCYLYITKDNFLLNMINPENIHDPNNPYYNPEEGRTAITYFIYYNPTLVELSAYLVEKGYLDEARFEDEDGLDGHKLLQDNIRFLGTFMFQYSCYNKE